MDQHAVVWLSWRAEIEHDSQISKALMGAAVGDICGLYPVRDLDIKLSIKRIIDSHLGLAATLAGALLVADLRPNIDNLREHRPLSGYRSRLCHQVLVDLAIAIDPTALLAI